MNRPPRHVSDILRDITEADELPPGPRRTIRHAFSRHCGCARCMGLYIRSVEGKGDAA